MRWIIYFILIYLLLGLQLGIGAYAQFHGVAPNLVLLIVVFIALHAPREEALLGCFMLGILQDLVSVEPIGLYAFSYGLVALVVTAAAPFVRRSHPLTHVAAVLLGGVIVTAIMMVHGWLHPITAATEYAGTAVHAVRLGPRVLLVSALYTTLLAPVILGVISLVARWLGMDSHRRRSRV